MRARVIVGQRVLVLEEELDVEPITWPDGTAIRA